MRMQTLAMRLERIVESATNEDDFLSAMGAVAPALGFQHFAVVHHMNLDRGGVAIRLHNYPNRWADYYEANRLITCDPVHRTCHVTNFPFVWNSIEKMISLGPRDRMMFALGQEEGIGDGFTIPVSVPGEASGSCSFANYSDRPIRTAHFALSYFVGSLAFEVARRLWTPRGRLLPAAPVLTDRQRDCLLWVARGKSDIEIGQILGVSRETVICHIKQACERYGVTKRTSLLIRAVLDGTLMLSDLVDYLYPHLWG
jgi:DNA-binding CsgD family transcriptional regulator